MRFSLVCLFLFSLIAYCSAIRRQVSTGIEVPHGFGLSSKNPLPSRESIDASPIVLTEGGYVQGYESDGVLIFRGIPFAAPPVGQNRFRPPQPAQSWSGVRDCLLQSNICPQFRLTDFLFMGNEDCLYLDIYMPANAPLDANLPVFFWIFGGAWVLGDNWEFGWYDATNLVKTHGYIFVAPNYRLGPLGFLALDQLKAENGGSAGNMALQDQRFAMQWVQRNIANFGGNPKQVTIFGESAGAFSVCFHLASPASKGLFQAAIMESGTCDSNNFFFEYSDSVSFSNTFAEMVGCDPTDRNNLVPCLRKMAAGDVMGPLIYSTPPANASFIPGTYPVFPWGATIDHSDSGLQQLPINAIANKQWNNVPIIAGTNADEGDIFVPLMTFIIPGATVPISDKNLVSVLQHFFNNNDTIVNGILDVYPSYEFKDAESRASIILRDFFFACSMRRTVRAITDQGQNAWLYHFTYKGDFIEDPILGDYHSAELDFVFNNPWPPLIHIFSERDIIMAQTFGNYWANHVFYQNPNGPSGSQVTWPTFTRKNNENLIMDVPPHVEIDYIKAQCDFWDTVLAENPWTSRKNKYASY